MPSITVSLPIYNAEQFLEECLHSIIAQTFEDFEVVAILDAPTDRSAEILRDLADKRFHIFENEQNIGLTKSIIRSLEIANTNLIARMDADDVMHTGRLRRQYEFMNDHPEIDVLGSWFDEIDEQGNVVQSPYPFPTAPEEIRNAYRTHSVVHHPTVMFRLDRILAVGNYDPQIRYAEDYNLFMKCLAHGYRFANIPEPLLHYRVHRTQLMSRRLEPTLQMIDRAYATYGKEIWGSDAPDYVSGTSSLHRLWRRFKRHFQSAPIKSSEGK